MGKKRIKVKRRGVKPFQSPNLRAIEGARAVRKDFEQLVHDTLKDMEARLVKVEHSYRDTVRAVNAASALLAAIERHLDKTAGENWDEGIREVVQKKINLGNRLKKIYMQSVTGKEDKPERLIEAAEELEAVAVELGSFPEHAPAILNLLSRSRDTGVLRAFCERTLKLEDIDKDLRELMEKVLAAEAAAPQEPTPGGVSLADEGPEGAG